MSCGETTKKDAATTMLNKLHLNWLYYYFEKLLKHLNPCTKSTQIKIHTTNLLSKKIKVQEIKRCWHIKNFNRLYFINLTLILIRITNFKWCFYTK
jgi:hypothetical protein